MEVWKDIEEFPGYQVSNEGRVRRHNKVTRSARYETRRWKDRILKQKIGKDKCCRVALWKDGNEHTVLVHRLEAVAFLGGSLNTKMTVNHIDGNRLNNRLENLEWLTRGDNIREGFRTGLYNRTQKPCALSPVNGGEALLFKSLSEASRFLGRGNSYCSEAMDKGHYCYSPSGEQYTIEAR